MIPTLQWNGGSGCLFQGFVGYNTVELKSLNLPLENRMRLCPKLLAVLLCLVVTTVATSRERPAPSPSRYSYTLEIDAKSLPKGVTLRVLKDEHGVRNFIKNPAETPLVVDEIYSNDRLVSGKKLVDGKVFGWFPNGVPMQGKTHLKGWQMPFGVQEETILRLPRPPAKIYEGRKPGLDKTVPKPEPIKINTLYDGKAYEIKATVIYALNPQYDKKP